VLSFDPIREIFRCQSCRQCGASGDQRLHRSLFATFNILSIKFFEEFMIDPYSSVLRIPPSRAVAGFQLTRTSTRYFLALIAFDPRTFFIRARSTQVALNATSPSLP
jgi:hypothetical protein